MPLQPIFSTAAIASNAAENLMFDAAFNVVCNAVSLCLQIFFDVALNVAFNVVSLLFRADFNVVPKDSHSYFCIGFSFVFWMFCSE